MKNLVALLVVVAFVSNANAFGHRRHGGGGYGCGGGEAVQSYGCQGGGYNYAPAQFSGYGCSGGGATGYAPAYTYSSVPMPATVGYAPMPSNPNQPATAAVPVTSVPVQMYHSANSCANGACGVSQPAYGQPFYGNQPYYGNQPFFGGGRFFGRGGCAGGNCQ